MIIRQKLWLGWICWKIVCSVLLLAGYCTHGNFPHTYEGVEFLLYYFPPVFLYPNVLFFQGACESITTDHTYRYKNLLLQVWEDVYCFSVVVRPIIYNVSVFVDYMFAPFGKEALMIEFYCILSFNGVLLCTRCMFSLESAMEMSWFHMVVHKNSIQ